MNLASALAGTSRDEVVRLRRAAGALYRGEAWDDCAGLAQQGVLALVDAPCREMKLRQAALAALQTQDLHAVTAALEAASVPFVLLKGLGLAAEVYDALGDRLAGDIDLAIPRAQHARAMEVLAAAGLRHEPTPYTAGSVECFVCPRHGTALEAHFALATAEQQSVLFTALLAAPRRVRIDGRLVPVPDPAAHLAYLFVHLARHLDAPRAVWIEDLRRFIARHPDLDWARFTALVAEAGAANAVALSLELAQALAGGQFPALPAAVELALGRARTWHGKALYHFLVPRLLSGEAGGLARRAHSFGLCENWSDRALIGLAFARRRLRKG